ncbi:hypothetical protein CPB83DRAFT_863286 [Crepidotus variabilis]|uniref:DUF4360 domain-containing protein n=1 Tax=Crepidotus variabilis TaxID=179855 RepID=A0A9P6E609_9AGAR|nr:hypothetical protein CPB83DRAFT_863286 [Crepidotus variabilis]
MAIFLAGVLALASLISGASAGASDFKLGNTIATGPPGFNITSLGVNGSGCPAGTFSHSFSDDNTAMTLSFNQYYAKAGPGVSISQSRKNCQLTASIVVPPGYTFGISSVEYRGYYQLDKDVEARQAALYYFQGNIAQAAAQSTYKGPVDGRFYTYQDTFDLGSTVLAPCGGSSVLNINNDVRINNAKNREGSGFIAADSVENSLLTTYNFQWRTCS